MDGTASIPDLVRRLRSSSRVAQLQSVRRLTKLVTWTCAAADEQVEFAAAGGIEAAVQLLQRGTPAMRAAAANLLAGACHSSKGYTAAMVAAGGIPLVLGMLQPAAGEDPDSDCAYAAVNALQFSAEASPAAAHAIVAAGGVPVLSALLRSAAQSPFPWWTNIARTLVALLPAEEGCAAAFAAGGAIEALLQLVSQDAVTATGALGALCEDSAERCAALAAAGGVPVLLHCLHSHEHRLQINVLQLLENMLAACPHLAASVEEVGGSSQLRRLLSSSHDSVRGAAAEALDRLAVASEQLAARSQHAVPTAAASVVPPGTPARPARPPRVCGAPGCGATSGLKRCGGCGTVRYCSTVCSRAHWPAHKAECRRLQAERAAAAEGCAADV